MARGKFKIAFKELLRERNLGTNILLEGMALLLIGVLIFLQALDNYNENETDKILKYGVRHTGKVVDDYFDENLEGLVCFEDEIRNIEGICQVGSASEGSFYVEDYKDNVFGGIYGIQKGHQDFLGDVDEEEFGKSIESVNFTEGSEKLFNLEVSEGYKFHECSSLLNDYSEVIYLGSKVNKLEIGTEIYRIDNTKAIIGGYIGKNNRMVKDKVSDEVAYMDMDYKVLIVRKDELENRSDITFAIDRGYDMDEVREDIGRLAAKCKVDITVKTYTGIFDGIASSKKALVNLLERLLAVVFITVIILQICMQSTHIIENFKNYGILYANGFSAAGQFFIFAVQSFIKGIVSMCLALGAGYFLIGIFYSDEVYSLDILYDVLFKYVLWKIGLCTIIISVFSVVISIVVFKGKTPKELIQER